MENGLLIYAFYPKLWKIEIKSLKNFQIGCVCLNSTILKEKQTGVKFNSRLKSVCVGYTAEPPY